MSLLKRYWLVAGLVLLVSLLHYNTAIHIHAAHGIYRRLYYFPIIVAAFRGGRAGGVLTALAVCAFYAPHAFGLVGFDPAMTLEKVLEMMLYLAVGLVCGTLVDRERATQSHLRRTTQDLARSERLAEVGRLSAGLAHEIRNPLASIKGSAEILAGEIPPQHPKARFSRILLEETARLNGVLTRFLEFARPRGNTDEVVDLGAELALLRDVLAARADAPALRLRVPAERWTLRGDTGLIRQMLLNVGLNAIQAGAGEVELALLPDGDSVTLAVTDHGPGFTAEAVANLGSPFFSTRPGGTGLGLATSVRIARDHGGDLTVDTAHEGGARVLVRLPATRAQVR
jgi:two-component system, NtrC family, sensor histidine kinase HydH